MYGNTNPSTGSIFAATPSPPSSFVAWLTKMIISVEWVCVWIWMVDVRQNNIELMVFIWKLFRSTFFFFGKILGICRTRWFKFKTLRNERSQNYVFHFLFTAPSIRTVVDMLEHTFANVFHCQVLREWNWMK